MNVKERRKSISIDYSYRNVRPPSRSAADKDDRAIPSSAHVREKRIRDVQLTKDIYLELLAIAFHACDKQQSNFVTPLAP